MTLVFGSAFQIGGGFLACLVVAAGLMAAMTLAGWAALSTGRLTAYAWSWACTPVVAVAVLMLDASVAVRSAASLLAAPLAGLAVLASLTALGPSPSPSRRPRQETDAAPPT